MLACGLSFSHILSHAKVVLCRKPRVRIKRNVAGRWTWPRSKRQQHGTRSLPTSRTLRICQLICPNSTSTSSARTGTSKHIFGRKGSRETQKVRKHICCAHLRTFCKKMLHRGFDASECDSVRRYIMRVRLSERCDNYNYGTRAITPK